jgi:hypothetical protein
VFLTGEAAAISQRFLGNYFAAGTIGQGNFIRSSVQADVLSQWAFGYDPNLAGAAHVFRDDAGRVRFFRGNADLSEQTSQGFAISSTTNGSGSSKWGCSSMSRRAPLRIMPIGRGRPISTSSWWS